LVGGGTEACIDLVGHQPYFDGLLYFWFDEASGVSKLLGGGV